MREEKIECEFISTIVPTPVRVKPPPAEVGETIPPRLGRFGAYDPRERHAVIRAQSHAILHTATVPYIVFERPALWLQSSYRMQGLPVLDTNLYPRLSCPGPGMNATTLSS